ncbi:MAG: heme A synthase [Gaiellaceae bacterium]
MHVESTRAARIRAFEVTPERFRKIATAALLAVGVVISTGAVVRLTGSGLGCENWPRCGDTPFPERDAHAAIEFGNRVIGAVTIGFTLVLWLAARRVGGLPRRARRLALALFAGNLAQIPLGGLTVIFELHPLLVMSHFLLAMAMLAVAVVVVVEARGLEIGWAPPLLPRELRIAGLALAGAGALLVTSGAFATAAGPHAGDSSEIDRLGEPLTSVYVHAGVTAVFGCAFLLVLGYLAARRTDAPRLFVLALGVLALLGLQVGLGELQYHTGLPWGLVLIHVWSGSAVWAGVVALAYLLARPLASLVPRRE